MVARLSQITMSPACPDMAEMVLRLARFVGQLVEQRIALRPLQADDAVQPVEIEIERLAAGLGMGPHQRMLDVRRLGDLLRRARRRPVAGARRVVAVDGAHAVDPLAQRLGQRLVDRVHVAEPGRAAAARDLHGVQQGRLGRHGEIGIVGVPVLGADRRLVGRAVGHERAHHDRDFRRPRRCACSAATGSAACRTRGRSRSVSCGVMRSPGITTSRCSASARFSRAATAGSFARARSRPSMRAPSGAFQGNDFGHAAT